MKTVLITGGTGLVGTALTKKLLEKGYKVVILTRRVQTSENANLSYATWDVEKMLIDSSAISQADYIVHLAGANVAEKRWTKARKQQILDSRVKTGKLICNALRNTNHKVKAILSASAIGWYGPDPAVPNPNPFTEDQIHYNDFLGQTCCLWEAAMLPVTAMGIRLCIVRTGIVLSSNGGALKEFLKPLKLGFAPVLGSGRQVTSWIHITDLVQLYVEAIEKPAYSGVYNVVAPEPVSSRELVVTLADMLKGRFYTTLPVPAFALKLILGQMSIGLLKSATVSADKLLANGFQFQYGTIKQAMAQVVQELRKA